MGGYYEMSDLPVFSAEASVSAADAYEYTKKSYEISKINNLQKLITAGIAGFSLASVFASLLAIGMMGATILAYGAFGIPIALAPIVIFQRCKIQWGPSFREVHNKLRMKANEFAYENFRLQAENGRLEIEVKSLSNTEDKLNELCKRENKDVNEFKKLLKENKQILEEKEQLLAAQEMQAILTAFHNSERVVDNVISERELDRFIIRLKGLQGSNTFFNEEAFRAAFAKSINKTPDDLLELTNSYLSNSRSRESSEGVPV